MQNGDELHYRPCVPTKIALGKEKRLSQNKMVGTTETLCKLKPETRIKLAFLQVLLESYGKNMPVLVLIWFVIMRNGMCKICTLFKEEGRRYDK